MQTLAKPVSRMGRQALLFPLCLVLFEFATYIGNDMIQPGMLTVVSDFGVGQEWVPTSMTAYLAGGMCLQWLLGPLSDRRGRRPVMLAGIAFFILSCLSILFANTIEQFIACRFFQGMGLCFIGAVGYATIQESFDESLCIKLTALMANVAMIAPLAGPLAGAALIHVAPWQWMFVIFALLSAIAFVGLWHYMPESATRLGEPLSLKAMAIDYRAVLKNKRFICGAVAIGLANLPLLAWIAQSPVILISGESLSTMDYALLQIPVFGFLMMGNVILARLTGKYSVPSLVKTGAVPMLLGLIVAAIATEISEHAYLWMTAGLSLYALGIGIAGAGLYRLALFSSSVSKGAVSAALGMISMFIYTVGIEGAKVAYLWGNSGLFNLYNLLAGVIWLGLVVLFLRSKTTA